MSTNIPGSIPTGHGGVRGATFDRRSSQFEGRFGRLFRSLPAASWSNAALALLAGDGLKEPGMVSPPEVDPKNPKLPRAPDEEHDDAGQPRASRLHDDEENSGIDAGYTYLGQFIDHDITFDPASSLQAQNDVDALVDFRTPRLDLDSLYGRGPADQPYLYAPDGVKFELGRHLQAGVGGPRIARDLPRYTSMEGGPARALIGDKRNDENVIVAQLHAVFLQFHNRIVERYKLGFEHAQRLVRWHYQYVVLHDFLRRIAREDVLYSVLPHLKKGTSLLVDPPQLLFYQPGNNNPFIPVEFAAAAYRFGHSMVRPIYRLNAHLAALPAEKSLGIGGRQFIFAGLKQRGLTGFDAFPDTWAIDWNLYFDLNGDAATRVGKDRTQPSYKIDTSLVNPLAFLSEFSVVTPGGADTAITDVAKQLQPDPKVVAGQREIANLALRNLLRGRAMGLPSGESVALAMGETPLRPDELRVGKATTKDEYLSLPELRSLSLEFNGKTPLWFYVLAEAQNDWFKSIGTTQDGAALPTKLGRVGSRIVVETLVGLLLHDGHSILRAAPGWVPSIGKAAGFDMPDLVRFALSGT